MEKEILTLGGVEFTPQEVNAAYNSGKRYIVRYRTIYEIRYSQAQQTYYATKLMILPTNWTARGRFVLTDEKNVNHIIEHYGNNNH